MAEDRPAVLRRSPRARVHSGQRVPPERITAAEAEPGVVPPPSHRRRLIECGSTGIDAGEVFTLAPDAFVDLADTDPRYRRRLGDPWRGRLLFHAPNDESRLFDFTRPTGDDEVMVLHEDLLGGGAPPEEYAESFAGFVLRRLREPASIPE